MDDVRLDRHDRGELQERAVDLVGGVLAVLDDARAYAVKEHARKLHDRSAVREGPEGDLDARGGERFVDPVVFGLLLMREGLVESVGGRHVGEHAFDLKARERRDLLHVADCERDVLLGLGHIADPPHSGIYSDQAFDYFSGRTGRLAYRGGILRAADHGGDVVFDYRVGVHRGRKAEHDDGLLRAGFPELDGFLKRGDGERVDAVGS